MKNYKKSASSQGSYSRKRKQGLYLTSLAPQDSQISEPRYTMNVRRAGKQDEHSFMPVSSHSRSLKSIDVQTAMQPDNNNAEVQTSFNESLVNESFQPSISAMVKNPKASQYIPDSSNDLIKMKSYFKSVYLFKDLPQNFIENLIKVSNFEKSGDNDKIFQAGSVADRIIVIKKGNLQYVNKLYGPGSNLFAESLIIPEEIHEDVTVVKGCEYFLLSKKETDRVTRLFPAYRDTIMRCYLDKNVQNVDADSKDPLVQTKQFKNLKYFKRIEKKNKMTPKRQTKSFIDIETLIENPHSHLNASSDDPLATKVQRIIEDLLNSADPYEAKYERPDSPIELTANTHELIGELTKKVDRLYTYYEEEVKRSRAKETIEREAKNHFYKGDSEEINLVALKRDALRKYVEVSNINDSEDL